MTHVCADREEANAFSQNYALGSQGNCSVAQTALVIVEFMDLLCNKAK